jgi:hypothetical protein
LSDNNLKLHIIAMFVIVNLQNMVYTQFLHMFNVDFMQQLWLSFTFCNYCLKKYIFWRSITA